MKTFLKVFAVISCGIIVSCKKSHTCTCAFNQTLVKTIVKNDGSSPISSTTTFTDNLINSTSHMTKKTAEMTFNCNTRIETYSITNTTYSGTLTTVSTSEFSDQYDCTLK